MAGEEVHHPTAAMKIGADEACARPASEGGVRWLVVGGRGGGVGRFAA